jgi:uncharacterized protein YndB with AHSA1/START domain
MSVPVEQDISLETVLPHAPEVVWKALTAAELIDRWLMPNDFVAELGKKFTFTTKPRGDWDGIVHCEVLEIVENRRLVYSWKGGLAADDAFASLDTVVTWTLLPVDAGTRLSMIHAGFELPRNKSAYDAMSPGWGQVLERLERTVAETASAH